MKKLSEAKWFYPCLLTLMFIFLLVLTIPSGCIYGSEGDWFSQHIVLAEQFRQLFYETGQIFPDYTLLGGGSNIYDISYYGFLRPDVLISFLLPAVSMKYIVSGYMILELLAAINLCYFWLKKHVSAPFFAFFGALLFSLGGFIWQGHHQIMFVNYLPFLFLSLLGIDHIQKKKKATLLIFSLFLLYLHSFYFSVSVLFVCFLYLLHGLSLTGVSWKNKDFKLLFGKFAASVLLSIGMAAVLLLPTALTLLSNRATGGITSIRNEVFSCNLSMDSLLYSAYSCGLTLICLYTLLLSIRRKSTRILGIVLMLCLTLNTIPYVLSGFLYIRYKVLIPLVPLFLLLCVQTLDELKLGTLRHSLPLLVCCLIPAFFQELPMVILWDFIGMAVGLFLCYLADCRNFPLKTAHSGTLLSLLGVLVLVIFPLLAFLTVNAKETYIADSDQRQSLFSTKELSALDLDANYRFDYLTTPFSTVNQTASSGMGSTNLYSSITNKAYADYFYNITRNPIRIRNRVALMTDANPFFSYLMGIRYIQTRADYLPLGYTAVASAENTEEEPAVIAENPDVLPIAYTSTSFMTQSDYDTLDFPYNLIALTNHTILSNDSDFSVPAPDASPPDETFSPAASRSKGITPVEQTWQDSYDFSYKEEESISLPVDDTYKNKILILSFDVTSPKGKEVTIDINGTRNKLSGKNAPYPNENHCFTYILSDAGGLETLNITFSNGTYSISNIHAFVADPDCIGNDTVVPFSSDTQKGNAVLKGTATLKEDGYFVTSLPYRPSFQAYADGRQVSVENINKGFVGFPMAAGTHEITVFYSPLGKKAGIIISLVCFAFLLCLSMKQRQKKRGN